MLDFKEKNIAIVGLGIEGLSSLKFLSKESANLSVRDEREERDIDQEILKEANKLTDDFTFGQNYLEDLQKYNFIVRSPSVRPDIPAFTEAKRGGVEITSNMKIFFDLCPAKIIGITGTKGKGTTTSLIGEMLKASGKKVYVGGNIGQAPLDFIEEVKNEDWVVLEMSSFQLMDMEKSPHVAVVLMVTSEHLDWHKDSQEYIDAKTNIVSHQKPEDYAVINVDYLGSSGFSDKTRAKKVFVSLFKNQNPGVYLHNRVIVRSFNNKIEEIVPVKDIFLRGRHNVENIAAAAATSSLAGVEVKDIANVARIFKGLPHRLEFVRELKGIKYYNDSFSTTPETAIAALKSFTQPLIIVLGGSSKDSDYSKLGKEINLSENIKGIILIGETGEEIGNSFDKFGKYKGKVYQVAKDMNEIVLSASKIAVSGDVVLLSPASASFDMFRDYKDRGERFNNAVRSLT